LTTRRIRSRPGSNGALAESTSAITATRFRSASWFQSTDPLETTRPGRPASALSIFRYNCPFPVHYDAAGRPVGLVVGGKLLDVGRAVPVEAGVLLGRRLAVRRPRLLAREGSTPGQEDCQGDGDRQRATGDVLS